MSQLIKQVIHFWINPNFLSSSNLFSPKKDEYKILKLNEIYIYSGWNIFILKKYIIIEWEKKKKNHPIKPYKKSLFNTISLKF